MLSSKERRQVIFTADDFGLSESVNEGIERAYRDGVLSSASLMVGGAAVEDAVRRARKMPGLRIGLHVVVIEGPSVLPHAVIPALVNEEGLFPSDGVRLGLRYFFLPEVRHQLRMEIAAQFRAFAETGLRLDHADAHKHMHLHPTIGGMLIDAGFSYGLPAIRIPCEPVEVMAACGVVPRLSARAMQLWSRVLRRQAENVGLVVNDQVFGLAWSGAMTEDRLLNLASKLPDGLSEIYFHPAAGPCRLVDQLMPEYRHEAELAALCSPRVRDAFASIERVAYGDL
jgi:hopanoid biosynthesis associated protein HpnK